MNERVTNETYTFKKTIDVYLTEYLYTVTVSYFGSYYDYEAFKLIKKNRYIHKESDKNNSRRNDQMNERVTLKKNHGWMKELWMKHIHLKKWLMFTELNTYIPEQFHTLVHITIMKPSNWLKKHIYTQRKW